MGKVFLINQFHERPMMTEENIKFIAFCGLHCASCPGHKGRIANLARDLRAELTAERIDDTAEAMSSEPAFEVFKNYGEFIRVLEMLSRMRCDKICREGGGNPQCVPRLCCYEKRIRGCWECAEFETCEKLDFLKPFAGNKLIEDLRTLRDKGVEAYIRGKSKG